MKLTAINDITGRIILKTGLHIGAGDTEMKIGGTDNSVITHPNTHEPYVPGSSLKGKIRSLLEMRSGLMVNTKGEPVSINTLKVLPEDQRGACRMILKIFGLGAGDVTDEKTKKLVEEIGPTRASFADCPLCKKWKKRAIENNWAYKEVKSENRINRIMGTAEHPRFTERVPAGAEFKFCITVKQLDQEKDLEDFLLEGMKLLEMDALGGNGSRGYGRIRFDFDDEIIAEKFRKLNAL